MLRLDDVFVREGIVKFGKMEIDYAEQPGFSA